MNLNYWLFLPELWVILGIILILADLFIGLSYVLLPFSISSILTALLIFFDSQGMLYDIISFDTWRNVIYWFAGLSFFSVVILRKFTQIGRKGTDDINKY